MVVDKTALLTPPTLFTNMLASCNTLAVSTNHLVADQSQTWFAVVDVEVENENKSDGEQSRRPVDDEHDRDAQQCAEQAQPDRVVVEGWAPA